MAKEVLTGKKLYNKLYSAKDNGERTAWHVTVQEVQLEVLYKLYEWAKELLTQKS